MNIIKTITEQEQVNHFMKIVGQEMPPEPIIPNVKIQALRWGLIEEENAELQQAAIDEDIVEVADALCDLLYVVLGAFTAYGFSPVLSKELFDEVQRSNMSKTCATEEEANDTVDKLVGDDFSNEVEGNYNDYVIVPVEDRWVVNRVCDNKTMKSINYSKPDLVPILKRHNVTI